jgi:hypothetical protein
MLRQGGNCRAHTRSADCRWRGHRGARRAADRAGGEAQQTALCSDLGSHRARPGRNNLEGPPPAKVFDNPALLQVNPEYLAWLLSLPLLELERERLLGGNWKIRPAAGLYFKREWCAVADLAPAGLDVVRLLGSRGDRKDRA